MSETTKPKQPRDWQCAECGKRMTLKQAERAFSVGCAKCGGVDLCLFSEADLVCAATFSTTEG